MNKIKVGDYVKIIKDLDDILEYGFKSEFFKVKEINNGTLIIDTTKFNGTDNWYIDVANVEKIDPTDLECAQERDIIYDPEDEEYSKVLGRCGRMLFITDWYEDLKQAQEDTDSSHYNTIDYYKEYGYTRYVPEEKTGQGIFSDMNIVVDKFMEDIEDFKNKLNK